MLISTITWKSWFNDGSIGEIVNDACQKVSNGESVDLCIQFLIDFILFIQDPQREKEEKFQRKKLLQFV